MKNYSLFLLFLFSFVFPSNSQLIITPNVGNTGVINTVGGTGIVVSNVTINCGSNSYGTFSNGNNAGLGLGTGLILTTGQTSQINSNGTNQNDDFDIELGTLSNDPQLTSVIGSGVNIFDPCIIEFDVVPQCGLISITFVFGSDEYTNYVSAGFNDGFGFFVTGPKPTGGNYTNTNIATLPNGTIVSIDNVNTTMNPTFFTNNNNGSFLNHLDGFTHVLTPTIAVIPCQTYHFKLAIADAADANIDSAVLIDIIQCSNPLVVATSSTPDHCGNGIGTAAVTTTGGTGPFQYSWSPTGGNNSTAQNLQSGTYTVTVVDALACTPNSTSTVVVGNTGIIPTVVVPANIVACNGQQVNLNNFSSSQTGTTFSWTNSNPSIGLLANGIGGQPAFLAINTGNTPQIATITVTPSITGECPGVSSSYTITVMPTPIMNPISNIIVCAGTMITVSTFSSSVAGTSYNWTNSNVGIGLSANGSTSINPFTSVNATNNQLVSSISIVPSASSCIGVPINFTISVNPNPIVNPISNVIDCVDNVILGSAFTSTPIGASFSWVNSNPSIGLAANGNIDYMSFTGMNSGSISNIATVSVTPTLGVCVGPALNYTITISPKPIMTQPDNISICANQNIIIPVFTSIPNTGVNYSWSNSDASIGLPLNGIGNITSFTGNNLGVNSIFSTINVIPSIGQCQGSTQSFTIEILPIPSMNQPSSITVCPNELISPDLFVSTPMGATFTWTNSNSSIGLVSNGSSSISPFTSINSTNLIQNSQINVVPTLAGCSGMITTFDIAVKPIPVLNNLNDLVSCANETVNLPVFISTPIGATFSWVNSNVNIGLGGSGNGSILPFTTVNNGTTPLVSSIEVGLVLSGCIGITEIFDITINPIPSVIVTNNSPLCEHENLELSIEAVSNAIYSWSGPEGFESTLQNPMISDVSIMNAGTYFVSVLANGCVDSTTTEVIVYPVILSEIISIDPLCINAAPVTLQATNLDGVWSGMGIVDSIAGIFDPSLAVIGINEITFEMNGECPTSTTTQIEVNPIPIASFYADIQSGCLPLEVKFINQSLPQADFSQWTFGDLSQSNSNSDTLVHVYNSIGCFDVNLISNTSGCSDDTLQSQMICVYPSAVANFLISEPDSLLTISNSFVHFDNLSELADSYSWSLGDGTTANEFNPEHLYPGVPAKYTVTLIANNLYNCPDTAMQIIQIHDELIFYVPNTFTPDNDHFNQTFQPVFSSGFKEDSFRMLIFNRWGEIIFESKNAKIGWDGTYGGSLVQDGVYTWKIEFKEIESDKKYRKLGHVNVLR
ncbi:MAG: choice-of-anchor L domain-containing protein [Flavobacteriia bacterium]|nr:choice-of-anchor L domain-containing protein [Flavobacteriia bacterium]